MNKITNNIHFMMNSSKRNTGNLLCPQHPDAVLVEDYRAGDMVCPECGLVVGDRVVDVGSEWRTFNNEKSVSDPSRVGAAQNPLLGGTDLSTMIERGAAGKYEMDSYSKMHNRGGASGSDRSLLTAFREISAMADRINIPKNIIDRANTLFKQVNEQKSLKGRSNDAIAAACLCIACRQEGVPRTFKEICAISKVSRKEIGRCFKLILRALETSVDLITSGDFMSRFCSNLKLSTSVQRAATHIARKAMELDLVAGRSPISVAAAAIYLASQASEGKKSQKGCCSLEKDYYLLVTDCGHLHWTLKMTIAEAVKMVMIGDIAGVADVTIRQSYRLMHPKAAELFPADFNFYTTIDKLPNS